MNITLDYELDFEQQQEITRQTLLEMLDIIEHIGGASDIPVWDAMNEVLAYMSTREELEEIENKPIRQEFLNLLTQESLKTFYTGLSNGRN